MNIKFLHTLLIILLCSIMANSQNVDVFVNAIATGSNDGSSWANAYTNLEDALDNANPNVTNTFIYVAQGIYKPSSTGDRTAYFDIKSNVNLYGGYPNTGNPTGAQRNPELYETILSGDLLGNDINTATNYYDSDRADNSYTVVKYFNATNTILDGVTIRKGNSNSNVGGPDRYGGGIVVLGNSELNIVNNVFLYNNTSHFGAAVYSSATPTGTNSSIEFKNCSFEKNRSRGSAIGFIVNEGNDDNAFTFQNCLMQFNSAIDAPINRSAVVDLTGSQGGVAKAYFKNCTIADNFGGDSVFRSSSSDMDNNVYLEISNSIIHGSEYGSSNSPLMIYKEALNTSYESEVHIRYSNLENTNTTNATTLHNISVDPEYAGFQDYSLTECSPVINRGDNTYADLSSLDIIGNPRNNAGTVDMGAYEFDVSSGTSANCSHIFVSDTAAGTNDGSSWANAFTDLQDALTTGAGTIYIAEGTYKPTSGTGRGATFDLSSNQILLGGYANNGGTRDPASNQTILSGNIDNVASYAGNSYHVMRATNVSNTIVDGLVIRDGNADNENSFGRSRGGGVYINGSSIEFLNTEIKWNKAIYGAGVFATLSPSVHFNACTFKKNTALNGSALYHSNETSVFLNSTKIIDNTATGRCAIEVNNSNYTLIENTLIANNASTNANAIAFIATNRDQGCDIRSSTILGENADKNLITMQVGFGDELNVSIGNSIIAHQNVNFSRNIKEYNNGTLNLTTSYSYVQGSSVIGTVGTGVMFSDVVGSLHLDVDYSLTACTPFLDSGNNFAVFKDQDLAGNKRIHNQYVDYGAYEYQGDGFCARLSNPALYTTVAISSTKVYPNPTTGFLNIETSLEDYTIQLYSLLGKQILNTRSSNIDINHLPAGIYILHLLGTDGTIDYQEKIVKR